MNSNNDRICEYKYGYYAPDICLSNPLCSIGVDIWHGVTEDKYAIQIKYDNPAKKEMTVLAIYEW